MVGKIWPFEQNSLSENSLNEIADRCNVALSWGILFIFLDRIAKFA